VFRYLNIKIKTKIPLERVEDIKGVIMISSHKSKKGWQYNNQEEKDKGNNRKLNIQQLKPQ
jgi:hypothetical protein